MTIGFSMKVTGDLKKEMSVSTGERAGLEWIYGDERRGPGDNELYCRNFVAEGSNRMRQYG